MIRNKRISLLILSLVLAASSAVAQPKKQTTPVREYTIEQFMNTVRIGGSSFSADEKSLLFHSNKSGIFNVYSVAVTGGAPTQLTNSTKESTFAVTYLPNDARFLYSYDRGGWHDQGADSVDRSWDRTSSQNRSWGQSMGGQRFNSFHAGGGGGWGGFRGGFRGGGRR